MPVGKKCTDPTHEKREIKSSGGVRMVCSTCAVINGKIYRDQNFDRLSQYQKEWRLEQRRKVFDHYGRLCYCCGLGVEILLTIDHVKPIGRSNRSKSYPFYQAVKLGFPGDLVIACFGCNLGKLNRPDCPHRLLPPTGSNATQSRLKLKIETMQIYGDGSCCCCGEDNIHLLTLDHVNGDGADHRRQLREEGVVDKNNIAGGSRLYRHLRMSGWPNDPPFRVLCGTCQRGEWLGGCPCGR